ncbi:MAG: hypothetical protein K6G91_11115 [Kiritimatiellae bacterium]|nr:hypothetical protein [Kiritimatiellia bacterium]
MKRLMIVLAMSTVVMAAYSQDHNNADYVRNNLSFLSFWFAASYVWVFKPLLNRAKKQKGAQAFGLRTAAVLAWIIVSLVCWSAPRYLADKICSKRYEKIQAAFDEAKKSGTWEGGEDSQVKSCVLHAKIQRPDSAQALDAIDIMKITRSV